MIGRRSSDPDAHLAVDWRVVVYDGFRTWRGVVLAGPRMIGRRSFQSWKVRPRDGGAARWMSVISIASSFPPPARLPA